MKKYHVQRGFVLFREYLRHFGRFFLRRRHFFFEFLLFEIRSSKVKENISKRIEVPCRAKAAIFEWVFRSGFVCMIVKDEKL